MHSWKDCPQLFVSGFKLWKEIEIFVISIFSTASI